MGSEPAATAGSADPTVSIVVVTYGTGPVVLEALAAVRAHTPIAHEVIVVDNPPAEGRRPSCELLEEAGWGAADNEVLVRPDRNLGFGGGCNLGATRARGRFLCFLNPDVVVGEGWLEPLLDALDDPVVGIAAPVFVDPDGSLQEAGQLIYDDGCTGAVGGPEVLTGEWSQAFTRDVDYASAACWVLRRNEFVELGGFDERYFPAYFEDADYALRVEAGGQRSRLVADVPVMHLHGQGGANSDHAIAAASQETFRAVWGDRLRAQPGRPGDDTAAIVNRDRLAVDTVGWLISGAGSTVAERVAALDEARAVAARSPRGRVVVVTDDATGFDLATARRAGVEVRTGRIDRVAAPFDTSGWYVVGDAAGGLRSTLAALWSPWTLLVGVAGAVLRWLVLTSRAGALNSDEAYTGLASMGVLDGRFPVVVDGNRYTAVIEAYLLAPVTAVVGPSILALKLVPVVMWAIAALCTYVAATALASAATGPGGEPRGRRVGAAAGAFVWIAPGALLVVSTLAYVGYALGMAIVAATLLWAVRVIDRDEPDTPNSAVLGGLTGLGFYVHPMFLAVIVPLVVPVAWVHRRRLRTFWVPAVVAGIVACSPFLLWNVVNGFPSLESQNSLPGTYTDRLRTFASELVPRGYGLRTASFDWILSRGIGLAVYVVLIVVAIAGCVALVRRGRRRSRLLLPIALVAVWPLMALFSPLIWSEDGRYNVIAFPLVAIAVACTLLYLPATTTVRMSTGVAVALVGVWAAVLVWPHTNRVVGDERIDANAATFELVEFLQDRGVERIAGSYWRVLDVEYLTDREIQGAVTWPYPVRFPERQRTVEASDPATVAFVFARWDEDTGQLWMPPERYARVVVGDSIVYVPAASG